MPPKQSIASLSDEEITILESGLSNPDAITDYFFRKPGQKQGWRFDYNFDPEGAWQKDVHNAAQKRIMVIGGFGSGKTRGIAMSACVWAMLTRDFAFMNAAPKAWQSELMYRFIMEQSAHTPFERLIYKFPQRPFPKIELRFWVGNVYMTSTMEFMSVDKNANQILSWEGDWVNIDEAGLLDDLEGTIRNLGSRMRGTVNNRPRLGRLSMASNSWDNPELWMRYDLASSLPDEYLSITVSTRHNHNITDEQLKMMLKDIPEEEHDRFIDGARPEGRGNYFSKSRVYGCESQTYGDIIVSAINQRKEGYDLRTSYGAGVTFFSVPKVVDHDYILVGDPGTGDAPARNAPVLMVWDVDNFPSYKANLVAFWWGHGGGSITPFTNMLMHFMQKYNPLYTGVDSTSTQKNTAEILNTYLFSKKLNQDVKDEIFGGVDLTGVTHPYINGLDFSGTRKAAYLVSGRLVLEAGLTTWPKFVIGLRSQLTNYDPAKDKTGESKIPQDLVAAFCMAAYVFRVWFNIEDPEKDGRRASEGLTLADFRAGRSQRASERQRSSSRGH